MLRSWSHEPHTARPLGTLRARPTINGVQPVDRRAADGVLKEVEPTRKPGAVPTKEVDCPPREERVEVVDE